MWYNKIVVMMYCEDMVDMVFGCFRCMLLLCLWLICLVYNYGWGGCEVKLIIFLFVFFLLVILCGWLLIVLKFIGW